MNPRRITLTLGTAAGGLLAAAFLPMAVAFADEDVFTPDTSTFAPTQDQGFPPLFEDINGTESWNDDDLTTSTINQDELSGVDNVTTIGPFTNDDFLVQSGTATLPSGTEIDLANFGGGFENEFISVPAQIFGGEPTLSDLIITPFGDFFLPI